MKIVPRNSPSRLKFIVSDIQAFGWHKNMKLRSEKCEDMIIDFIQYHATKWQPIATNGRQIEVASGFKLLGVFFF